MDWVQCPACQLKHRPREDGTCPRCRSPVVAGLPSVAAVPASPELQPSDGTGAIVFHDDGSKYWGARGPMRVAGMLLLVNGLAGYVLIHLTPGWTGNPLLAGLVSSYVFDVIVGVQLVAVVRRVLPLALIRAVVGGLVFGGLAAYDRDFSTAALQLGFSASQLLLLWGQPETERFLTGALGGAACLALPLIGLRISAVTEEPAARPAVQWTGAPGRAAARPQPRAPEGPPPEELLDVGGETSGYTFPLRMERPARYWRLRPADHALEADALSQFWWVEPRSLAQLRIRRHASNLDAPLSLEASDVARQLYSGSGSLEGIPGRPAFHAQVAGERPLTVLGARTGRAGGEEHVVHVEVHLVRGAAWSIVYSAPPRVYDAYLPDVRDAVAALEF